MPLTTKKLAAALVMAAAAITLVPLGADAATSVSTTSTSSTATLTTPVGFWRGTVEFGEGTGNVTFMFFPGGRVCLRSTPADGSGGGGQGTGTWRATGANTFTYQVREREFDANGTTTGFVDIDQNATQTRGVFTSSGMSDILDVNGNLITTVESHVNVSREFPPTTPRC